MNSSELVKRSEEGDRAGEKARTEALTRAQVSCGLGTGSEGGRGAQDWTLWPLPLVASSLQRRLRGSRCGSKGFAYAFIPRTSQQGVRGHWLGRGLVTSQTCTFQQINVSERPRGRRRAVFGTEMGLGKRLSYTPVQGAV